MKSGAPDYKRAFQEADQMLLKDNTVRHAVVLFSHSAASAAADADAVAEQINAEGREFYCMGLLPDPARLNGWASASARDHVAYADNPADLSAVIYDIAAEAVQAGVLAGTVRQVLMPEFRIKRIISVARKRPGIMNLYGSSTRQHFRSNPPEFPLPLRYSTSAPKEAI